MPIRIEPIDALALEHHQAMFHDVRLDERKSRARLISEDVDGHVKGRVVRQKNLQAGVFIAQKRGAFVLALVADHGTGFFMASKWFVYFLKNQDASCGSATFDLDVFPLRKIDVA